jgi:hypothetical protein
MRMVKLRNGDTVPWPIVVGITERMNDLLDDQPFLFFELVSHARDRHRRWTADDLAALAATRIVDEQGNFPTAARNVVLAASDGDGFAMRMVDPRHPDQIAQDESGQ